jgi:hypothetical protein
MPSDNGPSAGDSAAFDRRVIEFCENIMELVRALSERMNHLEQRLDDHCCHCCHCNNINNNANDNTSNTNNNTCSDSSPPNGQHLRPAGDREESDTISDGPALV